MKIVVGGMIRRFVMSVIPVHFHKKVRQLQNPALCFLVVHIVRTTFPVSYTLDS